MTISVSQLNNYIHGLFEVDGVLNDISVAGEITNLKQARDGWYFSLKDENAAIDCFCYGSAGAPTVGMLVVAEGKINFWAKSGRLSFFVRRLTASKNTGAAYLKFLQLKEKLQKEGLFDEIRKKPVPQCCLKIGVVTSATGAVIHDIENVALRRQPFSQIVLCPVKVQGADADVDIAAGVNYFSKSDVDVVIVGRGGGSNEDLSAFNSEVVVRAVAECTKPTVSAVGHGVDFTLCDFAADRRAVTPSEAAEFVTLDSAALKYGIVSRLNQLLVSLEKQHTQSKNAVVYSVKSINSHLKAQVEGKKTDIKFLLGGQSSRLAALKLERQSQVENLLSRISAANPANIMKRGFAHITKDGQNVTSVQNVEVGDELTVNLSDGTLETKVVGVKK